MARRVLVVEDEAMVAEVVERYLKRDGYEVDVAYDGNAALDSYELLPITLNPDGTQTAGTFTVGMNKLGLARWQVGASTAVSQLSPNVPAGQSFVYAIGGVGGNGMASKDAEAALVQAGGELGAFVKVAGMAGTGGSVAGAPTIAAANLVFVFGGGNAAAGMASPDSLAGSASVVSSVAGSSSAGDSIARVSSSFEAGTISGTGPVVGDKLTNSSGPIARCNSDVMSTATRRARSNTCSRRSRPFASSSMCWRASFVRRSRSASTRSR